MLSLSPSGVLANVLLTAFLRRPECCPNPTTGVFVLIAVGLPHIGGPRPAHPLLLVRDYRGGDIHEGERPARNRQDGSGKRDCAIKPAPDSGIHLRITAMLKTAAQSREMGRI
jgi:hypothetical protein